MHCRPLRQKSAAFTAALILIFALLKPAAADIGPGGLFRPDGSSIVPGAQTQVRMEDERVEINVYAAVGEHGGDMSFAQVDAVFHMRNLGAAPERMMVKFPLNDADVAGMSGDELKGFQAWVNGEPAEITYGEELASEYVEVYATWVYFEAVFPPGEPVTVRVSYLLEPQAEYIPKPGALTPTPAVEPGQFYRYVLVTGRDWKDTIGRAEIVVNFPYPVSPANVPSRPAGSRLEGNQVIWVKENFEPTKEDYISVKAVPPSEWLARIDPQAALPVIPSETWTDMLMSQMSYEQLPGDTPVWLANTFRRMAFITAPDGSKPAFSDYFSSLAISLYEKATGFDVGRRAAYIGIAELSLLQAAPHLTSAELESVLQALNQARAISPVDGGYESYPDTPTQDERIEAVYASLQQYAPAGQTLPTLNPATGQSTATQTLTPTTTITLTARPTRTSSPTIRMVYTATPPQAVLAAATMTTAPSTPPERGTARVLGWLIAGGVLSAGLILALTARRNRQPPGAS